MNLREALTWAIELAKIHEADQDIYFDNEGVAARLMRLKQSLPTRELRPEVLRELADDLLELHEQTAVTLDGWIAAREYVEAYHGEIEESGA
jgi:23S rRNA A2030 N6-methylase RlmJ